MHTLKKIVLNEPFFYISFFAITVICYFPSLFAPFYFDDFLNIKNNLDILGFKSSLFCHVGGNRPLSYLSFYINQLIFGMNPFWFRTINILIHFINGIFILFLVRQLLDKHNFDKRNRSILSIIVVGFWLLHPVNSQSVSYIVQRMTLLSTTFIVLGFYFYLKHKSEEKKVYLICFFISLLVSIGFKESGFQLLILVFVFEFFYGKKSHCFLWFLFILIISIIFLMQFFNGDIVNLFFKKTAKGFSIYERLLTEPMIILDYLKVLLFPYYRNIHLFYGVNVIKTFKDLYFLLPFSILILFTISFSYYFRDRKFVLFLFYSFVLLLLPESSILPLDLAYQHRLYLPLVFFLLTIFVLIFDFLKVKDLNFSKRSIVCSFTIMIFLCANLFIRNSIFANPVLFYENELTHTKKNVKLYSNFSNYLIMSNNLDYGKRILYEGLNRFPQNELLLQSLGHFFILKKEYDKSIQIYKKLLNKNNPYLNEAYNNLIIALIYKKDFDQAMRFCDILLKKFPGDVFGLKLKKIITEEMNKKYK